ncbi:hypothetical protein [Streptomyces sp. GbtcB6]|uniref:hypothetical protein n=1 Tax=Streptomyces sp. GbtcB6 TaxID=2824751 RepID=UPI001C30C20C|nr:hypothetical protein [Streptomyces sp. GbtcB6]
MALISPDAAPTVALASLCVTFASLALAFFAFRAGGPKVGVQSYIVKYSTGEYMLRLVVSNRGRSATTIEVGHLDVSWPYDDKPWRDTQRTLWPMFPAEFPFRLEGNMLVEWSCPATELMTEAIRWRPNTWRLHVKIGHRKRKVRISKTIALAEKVEARPLR